MLSVAPRHPLQSTSMQNLQSIDEEEESFKDKLKRTFSSIKRRKKKVQEQKIQEIPVLSVSNTLTPLRGHQPLRAVRSNPTPGANINER